jgi:hypothetical protein
MPSLVYAECYNLLLILSELYDHNSTELGLATLGHPTQIETILCVPSPKVGKASRVTTIAPQNRGRFQPQTSPM